MSFIEKSSCPCGRSEAALFDVPPTQVDLMESFFQPFNPVNSLSTGGSIEFTVPGSGELYIDPCMTHLYVKAQILKGGKPLVAADAVAPVNNLLHSLFGQVEISLNGTNVNSASNIYPYRAYIETLLGYSAETKKTLLHSVLWHKDTPGKSDDPKSDAAKKRREMANPGKSFEMMGKLHADFFNSDRLLLNSVEMKVKLSKNKDAFCLLSDLIPATGNTPAQQPNYTIQIEECTLFVRRVKVSDMTGLSHAKELEKRNAVYPLNRVLTRAFTIPKGINTYTLDNIFQGQLPTRIVLGLVRDDAYNGDFTKNPYNFQHFDLNHLCVFVNGKSVPLKPLTPDFQNSMYLREYHSLFSSLGIHFGNASFDLSYKDYASGSCLYAFDLTPDLCASETSHSSLITHGELRIEMKFRVGLPTPVCCIIYGEFKNMFTIARDRKVTTDFGQ